MLVKLIESMKGTDPGTGRGRGTRYARHVRDCEFSLRENDAALLNGRRHSLFLCKLLKLVVRQSIKEDVKEDIYG
jgi:hypothetical protein